MLNIAHRIAVLTLHAAAHGWDQAMLKSAVLAESEMARHHSTSSGGGRSGGSRKKRRAKLYARTHGCRLSRR